MTHKIGQRAAMGKDASGERWQRQRSCDDGCGSRRRRWRMTTAKLDKDSCGRQGHAKSGSRIQWGTTRVGGKRRQRQQSDHDGCSGGRWRRRTTTAMVENDSGGQQQRQMMTAVDKEGSRQQWHAILGGRLQGGRRRAGSEQQWH
jgi:hypothetical protein